MRRARSCATVFSKLPEVVVLHDTVAPSLRMDPSVMSPDNVVEPIGEIPPTEAEARYYAQIEGAATAA